ncbi:MAG: hypothetical protein KDE32_04405 [Novosphingobium sp.]|nr:hypothetical protein [Novosphingobium sp.]
MKRSATRQAPRRRGWQRRVLFWSILAAIAALVWFWKPLTARAEAGAAYASRIGCSCRFVAGRPLEQCRDDFLPGMGLVSLSEDDEEQTVTARVFPVASETARYRKGEGCAFEVAD